MFVGHDSLESCISASQSLETSRLLRRWSVFEAWRAGKTLRGRGRVKIKGLRAISREADPKEHPAP